AAAAAGARGLSPGPPPIPRGESGDARAQKSGGRGRQGRGGTPPARTRLERARLSRDRGTTKSGGGGGVRTSTTACRTRGPWTGHPILIFSFRRPYSTPI